MNNIAFLAVTCLCKYRVNVLNKGEIFIWADYFTGHLRNLFPFLECIIVQKIVTIEWNDSFKIAFDFDCTIGMDDVKKFILHSL